MAQVVALMAVLALFVVAVTATRSTITTVEIEDDNQMYGGGRCMQQMQMAGGLNNCRMFMMDQARCGGQRRGRCEYGRCDDDDNQYGTGMRGGSGGCMSMHFDPCCDQLRQMDQQCRCEGLRQMMMGQGQQMEEMAMVARNLPQMCGMGPQRCDMMRGRFDF